MRALFVLNFIIPFVMICLGFFLRKYPVSDMSSQNGYNTPTSRKSQAHWDYAQKIAPDIFLSLGKILLIIEIIVNIILLLVQASVDNSIIVGACVGMVFLFLAFYQTESRIKEKFQDKTIGLSLLKLYGNSLFDHSFVFDIEKRVLI
ncbi:MAG TPA: hypothetical protein DIT54_11870 [Lachnospiraceae bacterium]|nr:hypothetical protein [Lachnospiraceae bacterium]